MEDCMTWRQFFIYGAAVSVAPIVGMGFGAILIRVFTGRW